MRLSVIIPVYNEVKTIGEIIQRVKDQKPFQIIVVDDGSTDGTRSLLEWVDGIEHYFYEENRGKGCAIRMGLAHVKGDVVIIQDADLEYNPKDYKKLLKPFKKGADVVYGSRFRGESSRVLYFWHYAGNKAITILSNMFTNLNLTDVETCYKAFRWDVIKKLDLKENRFGFEIEVTHKLKDKKFYEVGIDYDGRTYAEGKKITWKDGLSALRCILRYR